MLLCSLDWHIFYFGTVSKHAPFVCSCCNLDSPQWVVHKCTCMCVAHMHRFNTDKQQAANKTHNDKQQATNKTHTNNESHMHTTQPCTCKCSTHTCMQHSHTHACKKKDRVNHCDKVKCSTHLHIHTYAHMCTWLNCCRQKVATEKA